MLGHSRDTGLLLVIKGKTMFYSQSTGGFYHPSINAENIPDDAVEITAERYSALLSGQSSGTVIGSDQNGFPILLDKPAPDDDALSALARIHRNYLLSMCDWTMLSDSPLTEQQKSSWVDYRQALRDVPDQKSFPSDVLWPAIPE